MGICDLKSPTLSKLQAGDFLIRAWRCRIVLSLQRRVTARPKKNIIQGLYSTPTCAARDWLGQTILPNGILRNTRKGRVLRK
jgi:hypothetical protein